MWRFGQPDTASWHANSSTGLSQQLSKAFAGPTIVVTHRGPSIRGHDYSLHGGPQSISAAFWSRLGTSIRPDQMSLWEHGHTHSNLCFEVIRVFVICNQRGYLNESGTRPGFDPTFVVDV
ncbi:MAG TPA: hypothetical protein VJX23_02095 [Candidatus Binataceae bacterium]|nr:hypothetical protein [Candidatus Binataceae bacterium]